MSNFQEVSVVSAVTGNVYKTFSLKTNKNYSNKRFGNFSSRVIASLEICAMLLCNKFGVPMSNLSEAFIGNIIYNTKVSTH